MKREDISRAAEEYAWRGDMYNLQTAFKAGAEWRINSVWHSNDVTPGYDCRVLIEDIYGKVYDDKYDADYNEYDSAIEQKEIKRWAYIEDILPTNE